MNARTMTAAQNDVAALGRELKQRREQAEKQNRTIHALEEHVKLLQESLASSGERYAALASERDLWMSRYHELEAKVAAHHAGRSLAAEALAALGEPHDAVYPMGEEG